MKWMYGVTAFATRASKELKFTLRSLAAGGFTDPLVFMDQSPSLTYQNDKYILRRDHIGLYPNFVLSLWELYLRNPNADRYALFQDDIVSCRNLRQYLEHCPNPDRGFWNLYLWSCNVKEKKGWSLSDQWGRGALGLVFTNQALRLLLRSEFFVEHRLNCHNGNRGADKAVMESFKAHGWREFIHNPGLIQHTGIVSSIPGKKHLEATSPSFVGEDFDAMELLK